MKTDNELDALFEEFGSSMAANVIVQGPKQVLDLRAQLLKGCVQCGQRIGEFMLPQDIACALTAGEFELKPAADSLLKGLWGNTVSLAHAQETVDGLVRASGDTATVLKTLKQVDPIKFLQVLGLLWRYHKEKRGGKAHSV